MTGTAVCALSPTRLNGASLGATRSSDRIRGCQVLAQIYRELALHPSNDDRSTNLVHLDEWHLEIALSQWADALATSDVALNGPRRSLYSNLRHRPGRQIPRNASRGTSRRLASDFAGMLDEQINDTSDSNQQIALRHLKFNLLRAAQATLGGFENPLRDATDDLHSERLQSGSPRARGNQPYSATCPARPGRSPVSKSQHDAARRT